MLRLPRTSELPAHCSTSTGSPSRHRPLTQAVLKILFVLTEVEIRVMQKCNDVVGTADRHRSIRPHWTWLVMLRISDANVRSRVCTRRVSLTNKAAGEGVQTPLNTNM